VNHDGRNAAGVGTRWDSSDIFIETQLVLRLVAFRFPLDGKRTILLRRVKVDELITEGVCLSRQSFVSMMIKRAK
jgi:hypothetical protein